MAKLSFRHFLLPKGRASRLGFLPVLLGIYVLWQVPELVVTHLLARGVTVFAWQFETANLGLALLAWPLVCAAARRCHDINLPMWPALIYAWHVVTEVTLRISNHLGYDVLPHFGYSVANLSIAITSIALCVIPGGKDDNRYGAPPRGPQTPAADVF
ncbi:DUF805 domain-containing protein [Asticcacaulis solisilvae]|uniref:DUF805 domain-containing protein n=1 Tax=Asticcacaulis solisilvae TaxID=1217274 RepID=UPI003FD74072